MLVFAIFLHNGCKQFVPFHNHCSKLALVAPDKNILFITRAPGVVFCQFGLIWQSEIIQCKMGEFVKFLESAYPLSFVFICDASLSISNVRRLFDNWYLSLEKKTLYDHKVLRMRMPVVCACSCVIIEN